MDAEHLTIPEVSLLFKLHELCNTIVLYELAVFDRARIVIPFCVAFVKVSDFIARKVVAFVTEPILVLPPYRAAVYLASLVSKSASCTAIPLAQVSFAHPAIKTAIGYQFRLEWFHFFAFSLFMKNSIAGQQMLPCLQ